MVSVFLSRTFLPPCSCLIFFFFFVFCFFFPFPSISPNGIWTQCSAWWEIPPQDTVLHLFQNRDTVSIAELPSGSPFALNMKRATETEKSLKTSNSCLVLFKEDPDAYSRWVGAHPSTLVCWITVLPHRGTHTSPRKPSHPRFWLILNCFPPNQS